MGTIEMEEIRKLADAMRKQPVQITTTDDDARVKQVESLVENMRWLGLIDRLDDIRDLLYINNLNQSAVLELMLGEHKTPLSKRYAVDEQLGNIKKIGKSMKERNNRTDQRIRKLQDELDALINGES